MSKPVEYAYILDPSHNALPTSAFFPTSLTPLATIHQPSDISVRRAATRYEIEKFIAAGYPEFSRYYLVYTKDLPTWFMDLNGGCGTCCTKHIPIGPCDKVLVLNS